MKVKFLLSTLFFALLLPTANAQDHSPNMGVVVQSTEDNADKSVTTVRLVNISGKEVTAFNLSVNQTRPDGKTFITSSANSYDLLGEYLLTGKRSRRTAHTMRRSAAQMSQRSSWTL
jgi:hypothetical protein